VIAREGGALTPMAEAKKNGWTVISMKNDWRNFFLGAA
jgi:hypothetical protein